MKILLYHNIDHHCSDRFIISPAQFKNHLRLLKALRYRSITLSEVPNVIADNKSGSPIVVLTFDDGYEDNYTSALPLLKQYGMKATLFTAAGWVGLNNEWDRDKRKRQFRHMGWDELREWTRCGMEIGSHTINHIRLNEITTEDKLRNEILGSKQILEEKLQQPIRTFSYPWGKYHDLAKKMVREAGYQLAVTMNSGIVKTGSDMYALPRFEVCSLHIAKFGFQLLLNFT